VPRPTPLWRARPLPLALAGLLLSPAARAVSLDEALRAAEQHSSSLQLADEEVEKARAMRAEAWALLSPKVVADASYTINDKEIVVDFTSIIPDEYKTALGIDADPITLQRKTVWAADATVKQPIFDAASLPLLRGAYLNVDANQEKARSARQQVRAGAAKAWYGLAVATNAEALASKALDSAKAHGELVDKQVALGLAPERARLQAALAMARAERDVASAHEAVVTAGQAFTTLTGLPAEGDFTLPDGPMAVPTSLDDALEKARQSQPQIRATATDARTADLAVTAKTLGWLPTVDGRFTWAYSQNTGFSDDPTLWMVVLSAQWILWDGGARLAETRQASHVARQANLLAQQAVDDTETGVRTAWERYQRASLACTSAQREQALASENLRLADLALSTGGATVLEVDDARLGVLAADLSALQERANRDLAAIDLNVAMGSF